jgi:CheY-like chemotaxis protein
MRTGGYQSAPIAPLSEMIPMEHRGAIAAFSRPRPDHRVGWYTRPARTGAEGRDMTQSTREQQRILAIVDDLLFASRIEGSLSSAGYAVQCAPVTAEAAAIAREWRPDAVVVSFGVPFRDWEGVIRAIRAEPTLRETPMLAFGPHVDMAGRAAAVAAGATRVVTNGAFFNRMPAVMEALLSSK